MSAIPIRTVPRTAIEDLVAGLDPQLFESSIDRAVRIAGIDKAAFAATFASPIPPALAALFATPLSRVASFLPPGLPVAASSDRKVNPNADD